MKNTTMTRRSFVAGTGLLGLAAASVGATAAMAEEVETFDETYDVVVVGFGFAGCSAAVSAIDAGAERVLVVDAAPEGHEGGNSRYCGQISIFSNDYDATMEYYHKLNGDFVVDDDILDALISRMPAQPDRFRRLGVEEPCVWSEYLANTPEDQINPAIPVARAMAGTEFPELAGDFEMDQVTAHDATGDGFFYNIAHDTVMGTEGVDVWLASPAKHLIVDAEGAVTGVQVEREGQLVNVGAKGVVFACGGFECNREMIQTYLGLPLAVPKGGLYNNGDGIRMALEVGADLWHMSVYETFGICGNYVWPTPEGERNIILGYPLNAGPMICVAEDGSRFADEGIYANRHGHVYRHGLWQVANSSHHPHMVFDESYLAQLQEYALKPTNMDEILVSAATPEELAELIGADPQILATTIERFNSYAENGLDYEQGRDPQTMAPIEGALYALPIVHSVLNTQGGPRRNAKAQIVGANGEPIRGLFSAGECGGITSRYYQGATNVTECLIFGEIAGTNAAMGVE